MRFEWDANKALSNKLNHDGISFEDAREAFSDFYGVEEYDYLHSINEHRFILIGMSS
ncbi:MAG: BrnT family toxin [Blastocatellia bacterium]